MINMLLQGIIFAFISFACGSSITTTLTHVEQHRITQKLNQASKDLISSYYAVTGLAALGKEIDNADSVCQLVSKNLKTTDAESVFQFSEIVKQLKCKNTPKITFNGLINDDTTALQFSYVISAMVNLGNAVDDDTVKKFVNLVKENDTPASAAAAFYAAGLLPKSDVLKPIVSMVEDIVAQADEIGGELLQFEGGLSVTADVVRGILKLSDQQNSKLIKDDQINKFAQYFLSRKYVYTLKDMHYLTTALAALANNKNQVPVAVSVFQSSFITQENPILKVRVTNVLDKSIPDAQVTAKSFATSDESVTLFTNKAFTKSTRKDDFIVIDNEVARGYINAHPYDLDVLAANPKRGMFKCQVTVQLKDGKQFVKDASYEVKVKVLARIMVEDTEIVVGDKDQALGKPTKLSYPNRLPKLLEADYHQKVVMTFNLKDTHTGDLVTAHQTFIRMTNVETQQEIFFVAEPDSDDHYTFTLDVSGTAKDSFNHMSGKYKVALIVGDSTMQVPISWTIGEISLTFSGKPVKTKRQERITAPQPIIDHMFRIPDKRPPKIVSTAFTFLVLSPLLLMIALWFKLGANLSNLSLSIPTLVFHIGLIGIFSLYYMFWIQLNMFQTLKLLAVVGGVTFLGGNKMLADMASAKYKS